MGDAHRSLAVSRRDDYSAPMSTAAPLPELGSLIKAAAGRRPADDVLAEPWKRGGETALWFSRSAWALAALVVWRRGPERPAPVLWLPDYFCNQSTEPARAQGARCVFYPIDENFEPDWDACRRLATGSPPDLFVLVHYFGAAAAAGPALGFCRETGAALIEDAAHVLAPASGIGEVGDAVFYSPHKLLAVPDGALLLVRDRTHGQEVVEAARSLGSATPWPLGWLARRLVQKAMPQILTRRAIALRSPAFADDPPFLSVPHTPWPSRFARRLLASAGRQMAIVGRRHHNNTLRMTTVLDRLDGAAPLKMAAGVPVPYRLVLRFDSSAAAAAQFATWRDRGVPVETWPDLAAEVTADPDGHAVALGRRQHLLFIPVHQALSESLLLPVG